eukprot:snap_masked-scaffold_17-processed-gene-2.25-mRNA-1 protein AED:1.00 eAED:1.00 QI:0/0/0/0/1/1/3/0/123
MKGPFSTLRHEINTIDDDQLTKGLDTSIAVSSFHPIDLKISNFTFDTNAKSNTRVISEQNALELAELVAYIPKQKKKQFSEEEMKRMSLCAEICLLRFYVYFGYYFFEYMDFIFYYILNIRKQ